jgi:hypothetical protein
MFRHRGMPHTGDNTLINITKPTTDAHIWSVTYHDGHKVAEHELPNFATAVDIGTIKRLDLSGVHYVDVPDGAEPVFLRRRCMAVDPNTDRAALSTVHCIGWKSKSDECYLFVREDGSTLLTSDFQAM